MKKNLVIIVICLLILSACGSKSNSSYSDKVILNEDELSKQESNSVNSSISKEEGIKDENAAESTLTEQEETPSSLKLIVPEGFTLVRIGMRLEDMGVCTVDEFIAAAQNGDYSEFSLVAQQIYNSERCYNLEGYLFPDTYEIFPDEKPESIIKRMLRNNENKYSDELLAEIANSEYTLDEIITLASILQKEGYERNDSPVPLELPKIASVLYNRLDEGMMLQCNVTATYVKGVLREFTNEGDRFNEAYNTYHCPALPAGAICNPGMDAIVAAVRPADTNYIYFISDKDKNFYYAETWEEHEKFVNEHLSDEKK